MSEPPGKESFRDLYSGFAMPLSEIDCGLKCGPYNDYGVPVCCDIHQVIPSAFELEWEYLRENTDLWRPWSCSGPVDQELEGELQDGQVLLECKGYQECERDFRTLTCRAFPFYPYLEGSGVFSGLAYYQDFRQECWIISNLEVVSLAYKTAFRETFQRVFELYPAYHRDFAEYSDYVRQKSGQRGERLVLLGFNGSAYLIDPLTEKKYQVEYNALDAFGPYEITRDLQFPDE